jgi:PAS domain S-box-containing protein
MLKSGQQALTDAFPSDRALSGIIDLVPDSLFVVDPDSSILDVNASFEARFGKTRQESIGVNMYELLASVHCKPEVISRLRENAEEIFRTGQSLCFDDEADGIWSRYIINPIAAFDGSGSRLFFIIQDISEQKLSALEEQKEKKLKKHLLDLLPASAVILDAAGRLIRWNDYARKVIFGKSEDEMYGTDPLGIVISDDRPLVKEKLQQAMDTDKTVSIEARVLVHGGPEFIWGVLYGRRIIVDGNFCVLIAGLDIENLKKLEEETKQNHARWDTILQKWHIGLWEIDLQTNCVDRTIEHDRIFGYESFQPVWRLEMFFDHVHHDDRAVIERLYREILLKKTGWSYECRIRRVDGEVRWISAAGALKFDSACKATHLQGFVQDITDRKQAELANQHLQEQLQQSQKMELFGQLAGGIAHEFNNVLTAILGNTEVLLNQLDEEHPAYENLEIISKSARRSADMVRQLLGFARKQIVKPKIIELDAEVEDLRAMLRQLTSENIRLQWCFERRHALILMDTSQLAQIVTNLVVNARDAITGSGTITITTGSVQVTQEDCETWHPCMSPGNFVTLSVSDTGSGIDKNTLAHIFEPYFTTKDIGKGTGLGLSTVYGIVKQNDGYVDCQSNEGLGSTFSIYLPEYAERAVAENGATPEQIDRNNSETILLVEDDPYVLRFLRDALETKGFFVISARDAELAFELASIHGEKIALLITDIVLPRMNGIQLGNKLHENGIGLRILYMSADLIDCQELFNEPVNFIAKPFAIDDFMEMVYRILNQPGLV